MTYQRNIAVEVAFSGLSVGGSDDALDEPVEEGVQRAEVGRGDRDEDHRDGGGLDQRLAIGPLHALELGPAGDEEPDDSPALARLGGLARGLAALRRFAAPALALLLLLALGAAADLFRRGCLCGCGPLLRRAHIRPPRRGRSEAAPLLLPRGPLPRRPPRR